MTEARIDVRATSRTGRCAVLASLVALLGGCGPHTYFLPPYKDVAAIHVYSVPPGSTITDPQRIAAIVAFLNARRDDWQDGFHPMAVGGSLALYDAQHKQLGIVSIGPSGMMQTRPDLSYWWSPRSHPRALQVVRATEFAQAYKDYAALCGIVGGADEHVLCGQMPPVMMIRRPSIALGRPQKESPMRPRYSAP